MIEVPGCRILIRPLKVEEQDKVIRAAKASGIYIPEKETRKEQAAVDKGVVLKLGPYVSKEYVEGVQEGDLVGFAKYGGKFVTDLESEEILLIINDEDVVCIFKEVK